MLAKRMFSIGRVQWCEAFQLHKIVAALMFDAKRQGVTQGVDFGHPKFVRYPVTHRISINNQCYGEINWSE
jgi:hypothetical protein